MNEILAEVYHLRLFHEFMHFVSGGIGSFLGTWAYFKWVHGKRTAN